MSTKNTKASDRETIQKEIDHRLHNVHTSADLAKAIVAVIQDISEGKITERAGRALLSAMGKRLKEMKRALIVDEKKSRSFGGDRPTTPHGKGVKNRLGAFAEQRQHFRATFVRYGQKRGYRGTPISTLLLRGVSLSETGEEVADHLWFTETKGFREVGPLKEGDVVEFDARATQYQKGYRGRKIDIYKPVYSDWRLSRPTQIKRLSK